MSPIDPVAGDGITAGDVPVKKGAAPPEPNCTNRDSTKTLPLHHLTTVFDPSKIKSILYKEESNMARLYGPGLKLISTTAALFLRSIIERAAASDDGAGDGPRLANQLDNRDHQPPARASSPAAPLVTLRMLREVVSSDPALEFLRESLDAVKDKDRTASSLSLLKEYVPTPAAAASTSSLERHPRKRKAIGGTASTNGSQSNVTTERRQWKKAARTVGTGSEQPSAESSFDPLERAIVEAGGADEGRLPDEIVPDEDDYD